jgi:hypothetical protein
MGSGALTVYMYAFWLPILLACSAMILLPVLDFIYYMSFVSRVRWALTQVSLLFVFVPLVSSFGLSVCVWIFGFLATLHAYAVNNEAGIVYSIKFTPQLAVAVAIGSYAASRLVGGAVGAAGMATSTGAYANLVFAARDFFSDKENLACAIEKREEHPIKEMKDWQVVSANNKKTKIRGTVVDKKGMRKTETWTIYHIYDNYDAIAKGGVNHAQG